MDAGRPATRSQPPVSLAEPTTRMLLALTFVTGIVDAVIFLGFGIAGTAGSPTLRSSGPKLGPLV